ncbi:class II fructose-bisphosphatase [Peribacillus sp. SCS-155]|uniref:class II fructose-bisphosphatase n=1 Tax=Peribacillus sedimenti TaxID=3115297 RepID=UPI003905CE68
MNHILMDFVEVTEIAAIASHHWIGRGNKYEADNATTKAMRKRLNQISMEGRVVIGEGELDEAPMLFIGEQVGSGAGVKLDIAVDPLEGTNLMTTGRGNSIAVIAASREGTLLHAPDMYMEKIAVGPKAAGKIDIEAPLLVNMKIVSECNGKKLSDIYVIVQDRERHQHIIDQIHEVGGRVQLFDDGDIIFSIAAAMTNSNVDMFIGIGGAPEGVLSSVALKCLGGELQGKLLPANEEEYDRCIQMGISNPMAPLRMNQLVNSDECLFAATGITDSFLLKGVSYDSGKLVTESLLMYGKQKKAQFIKSVHCYETLFRDSLKNAI